MTIAWELGIAGTLAITVAAPLAFRMAVRRGFRVPPRPETGSPADLDLPFRSASIPTERNRRLFAWHVLPPGPGPTAHIAVMHGWGANAEDMLPVVAPLHRAGYGVLLVDARSHGRSDPDGFSSMPRFAEDLAHAHDWLERQPEVAPVLAFLGTHLPATLPARVQAP